MKSITATPPQVEIGWLRPFRSKDGTITHFKMVVQTIIKKKYVANYQRVIEYTTFVYQDGTQEEFVSEFSIEVYTTR